MAFDHAGFLTRLGEATRSFDRKTATALCGELVEAVAASGGPYPERDARKILGLLRAQTYFDLVEDVAETLIACGQTAPRVRRQLAQGLIDQGNLLGASEVLRDLSAELDQRLEERPANKRLLTEKAEARGLLGRQYKQSYVDAAVLGKSLPKVLRRAIDAYHAPYLEDPEEYLWHGINAVACVLRAERDELELGELPDARVIAGNILRRIEEKVDDDEVETWDYATAMEACVALERFEPAVHWLARYLAVEANAFAYGSTLRQLEEVWQLDAASKPGSLLLPMLRARILQQEGGAVALDAGEVEAGPGQLETEREAYENVHGIAARFVEIDWWRQGESRCLAVARINDLVNTGFGTGFLVRGSDLHPSFGDQPLLMTNAHVVSEAEEVHQRLANPPLFSDDVKVTFQVGPLSGRSWGAAEILWSSPPWDLDVTVIRLDSEIELEQPYKIGRRLPSLGGTERLYIIGHPKGASLKFSLDDNLLLDYQRRAREDWRGLIHYRTPTEGGSSGSPVFDRQWRLVAIHHAGYDEREKLNGREGVYAANEGIVLKAIQQRLKSERAG